MLFGALFLPLAGCVSVPPYKPPENAMPARWSEAPESSKPAALTDEQWWKTFNDPELDSLIERAEHANPDLRIAEIRVREARARRGIAAAARSPSIGASTSISREKESRNAPNPLQVKPDGQIESPGKPDNLFQAGFDAAWELDLFGGARRSIEAAQADLEAVAYNRESVLLTLLAEVSRNYIELRGIQQQGRVARESLAAWQDMLSLVRARGAAGMASGLDVVRAEVQVRQIAAELPTFDDGSKRAEHRLEVLLGQAPGTLTIELQAAHPLPSASAEPPLGLPSDLLRRRPDIRSAERRVAAASARLGAATADLYPRFSLLGTAGLASVMAGDFFNGASALWAIGPSVTWPIFQGGRIKATIEVRDAQTQASLIAYRRAILNGLEDVENAIAGYRSAQTRQATLALAVQSQQQAVDWARERYAGGMTDFRDVLDAQRVLFEAQGQLVQADTAVSLDLIALYKALGGGWNLQAMRPDEGPGPEKAP